MPRKIDVAYRLWQHCFAVFVIVVAGPPLFAQDWPQLLGSGLRSGDASGFVVDDSLGLLASVPMTDAILASPVVAGDHVYAFDGSGVLACIDMLTGEKRWQFKTEGGSGNCNNVARDDKPHQFSEASCKFSHCGAGSTN